MGHEFRPFLRRGHMTPDWALIAVGLMACALLAGVIIPAGDTAQASRFGTHVAGLRALSATETLVVFEDYASGGGTTWSGGLLDAGSLSLGAIWLADPAAPLARDIALPAETTRAVISFDLIAIGDWATDGLEVRLDGTPILLHRFSTRADLARPPASAPRGTDRLVVRTALSPPQDASLASGRPAGDRLSVEIAVTAPGETLALSITPVPAETAEPDRAAPLWAVDNLIVVAEQPR